MANSKYEYVRQYEQPDKLLPNTWIVVRLDGRSFHQYVCLSAWSAVQQLCLVHCFVPLGSTLSHVSRFTADHDFAKPNDARALNLMNRSAAACMDAFSDIVLAYGESDEFRCCSPIAHCSPSQLAASYLRRLQRSSVDEQAS